MCGFIGVFDRTGSIKKWTSRVVEAGELLYHRGMDDYGSYFDNFTGFYFRRLSIIDLSQKGHQPFISDDGNLVLVYNGEIYNYKELRAMLEGKGHAFVSKSDTEVLMRAYVELGDSCVNYFRGMFAFAIWNKNTRELFLARDRFGIKPLYIFQRKDQYIFASEIKSILHFAPESKELDERSAFKYLARGFLDDTKDTFFKEIKSIEPATIVKITMSDYSEHKYWFLKYDENESFDTERFREVFEETISLHIHADVPVAATLSGGIDSTSIVGTVAKCGLLNMRLKTYSVFPPDTYDERFWIDRTVEYTGVDHEYVDLNLNNIAQTIDDIILKHDEPFQYSSCIFQYLLRENVARENIKVLLIGEGADEVLAGYRRIIFPYLLALYRQGNLNEFLSVLKNSRLLLNNKPVDKIIEDLLDYERVSNNNESGQENTSFYALLHTQMFEKYKEVVDEPLYVSSNDDPEEGFFRLLLKHIYVRNLPYVLKMEDHNSMSKGIEARVPFLDHVFVEMVFSHHFSGFMKEGMNKSMLRRAMSGYVPDEVLQRQSKSNRPGNHANLIYKHIRDEVADILRSSDSIGHFFARDISQSFEKDFAKHNTASADGWFRIYVIERWRQLLGI